MKILSSAEALLYGIFSDRSIIETRLDDNDMLVVCFFKSYFNVNSSKLFSKSYTNNTREARAKDYNTDSGKSSVFSASSDSF